MKKLFSQLLIQLMNLLLIIAEIRQKIILMMDYLMQMVGVIVNCFDTWQSFSNWLLLIAFMVQNEYKFEYSNNWYGWVTKKTWGQKMIKLISRQSILRPV